MGAPSSQVQSSQSSAPAGKGASASPGSQPMGKGSMSATSGQPTMGQPNTNSNTGLGMVNPTIAAPSDKQTNGNPYPNTVGQMDTFAGSSNNQPTFNNAMGKNGGGNQGMGKGVGSSNPNQPNPSGPQGPVSY
jgi:hypothetical protein